MLNSRSRNLAFLIILCVLFIPSSAFSTHDELLVRFDATATPSGKAAVHARVGATVIKSFDIVENLDLVRLPTGTYLQDAINTYMSRPGTLYAEPNYFVTTQKTPNDPRFSDLWNLHNIGQAGGTHDADIDAPEAWDITTGSNSFIVAVIDTGIDYNHQDLSANMFRNTVDCNNNGKDDDGNGFIDDCFGINTANNNSNPMDDHSHGTHVAGTIGAVGNNSLGVVGVNWSVRLMACKFLVPGFFGGAFGTIADAIDCLNYVAKMKDRGHNIIATNNSWGGSDFSRALFDAIDAHRVRGILFIAAAGNSASNNDAFPFYPASFSLPNIIAVAATTRTDQLASFSNFGRKTVHVGAPGVAILSTTLFNGYGTKDGTSMAAPHVTGLVALLKAQDPSKDWIAIKDLLLQGGDNRPALANITITGKRINARGSLNLGVPPPFTFTDDPLVSQVSPVKAVHVSELRQAINTLRSRRGLASFAFADSTLTPGVTLVRAFHVTDLRTALNDVYDSLARPRPIYTDPTLLPGQTVIKAAHIQEIRSAVRTVQ